MAMKICLGGMVMACVAIVNTNFANGFCVAGGVKRYDQASKSSSAAASLAISSFLTLPSQKRAMPSNDTDDDGSTDDDPTGPGALPDYELPEEKSERLRRQAEEMRKQIERLEASLLESRQRLPPRERFVPSSRRDDDDDDDNNDGLGPPTLRNKRILIAGANGRLGSMICRHLLRNHPEVKEVVALVHTIGETSTRGYGRLSYEVGAEDGRGSIGPFWDGETRRATFAYNGEVMQGYNLHKLRIVPCELLDPVQCRTVCDGVDSVVFCATDFNGNAPRALGLDVAFLFRAVARPTKGRVEIEGLENMISAMKLAKDKNNNNRQRRKENDPIEFLLVSMDPTAYGDFETPYGEFNAMKRQAEEKLKSFPSVTSAALQMGRYEDNFVAEGLDVCVAVPPTTMGGDNNVDRTTSTSAAVKTGGSRPVVVQRQINRRDAARATVEALIRPDIVGKTVQVYSTIRY